MKRLIIITLVLMLTGSAIAQNSPIDEGSKIIEGSLSFMYQSGDIYEYNGNGITTINVSPSLEFFVAPNILVGGTCSVQSRSIGGNSSTLTSFGAVVGYYFGDAENTEIKGAVYPYLKAIFLFSSPGNINFTTLGGKTGINLMLTNAVALDVGVSYQKDTISAAGSSNSYSGSIIMFGTGITAFIY